MPVITSSGNPRRLPIDALGLAKALDVNCTDDSIFAIKKNIPLKILREASIIQVKKRIGKSLTPDRNLIQAIEALDESHNSLNTISTRLSTWYSQITGNPRIKGQEVLQAENIPEQLLPLKEHYESSSKMVTVLSNYIEEQAPEVFPSIVDVVGNQLAVRLVSSAGSLSKLARMPSSTIQLLGAEKALFRHISEGSPPPKHGFLYQHPSVKQASRGEKGKVSRKLASKVAIASKIDFYRDKDD